MHERCAVMPIVDPTDNAKLNEPLAEVSVVSVDSLMNSKGQTVLQKMYGRVLKRGETAAHIAHGPVLSP